VVHAESAATTDGWSIASNVEQVHQLLCASDTYAAAKHHMPVPKRNPETSRRLVEDGSVHLLIRDGAGRAMFTLGWHPPYSLPDEFPAAGKPAYLQRLAVDPVSIQEDPLLGVQALRRAVEVAAIQGADAIRAETNPGLTGIVALLTAFGFQRYGPIRADGWMRRVYLQKQLSASSTATKGE
jgi:hypothetical protein